MLTRFKVSFFFFFSFIMVFSQTPDSTVTIISGGSPNQLWKAFNTQGIPAGIRDVKISSSYVQFANLAGREMWGEFRNLPLINGTRLKDGIVLTTGLAIGCKGPNDQAGSTSEKLINAAFFNGFGYPPDYEVQTTISAGASNLQVFDSPTFTVSFTSDTVIKTVSFNFVFGTEEWKEFLGSTYSDRFVCILDGKDIAKDVNGMVIDLNNAIKVDNLDRHINLQYDGFTYVLKVMHSLTPGAHTMTFAVADLVDARLDCGVFLSDFRFDSSLVINYLDIIHDQTFSVQHMAPAATVVGDIVNVMKVMGASLKVISYNPTFAVSTLPWADSSSWPISLAPGGFIDYFTGQKYSLTIQAAKTLSLTETVLDTAKMTILVVPPTPVNNFRTMPPEQPCIINMHRQHCSITIAQHYKSGTVTVYKSDGTQIRHMVMQSASKKVTFDLPVHGVFFIKTLLKKKMDR